jgi:hypothetical protein
MDIYAAQMVFSRGRTFDRLDGAARGGLPRGGRRSAARRDSRWSRPRRSQQIDSLEIALHGDVNSAFALFIRMFIIQLVLIAVAQRRGSDPARSAPRAGRFARCFWRAAFQGGGVRVGRLRRAVARLALYISGLIAGSTARRTDDPGSRRAAAVFSLLMGTRPRLMRFIPARNASRVDRSGAAKGRSRCSAGENRIRRVSATILGSASVALLMFAGRSMGLFYSGFGMAVLALLLLSPSGALWLTRALRPALRRLRLVEGALAADSLIQAPRRTSATVTALMLSLALVITLGGIARASYDSIMEWTTTALNPDLFVTASQSLTERNFRFAPSLGDELERIEGIDEVQRVRSHRIVYKGIPVMIVAVEAKSMGDRARRPPVEGPPEMYEMAAEGKGVILSDNFAALQDLHYGDIIELATPTGVHQVPIVGLVVDWSDQQGAIRWTGQRVRDGRQ